MSGQDASTASGARRVCVGVITGAHGVRGLVRVKSFTAEPGGVAAYGPVSDEAGRRFAIEPVAEQKGQLLARMPGVADRAAAEALRGVRLYVERGQLPEPEVDEFYHADLLGLRAERPDGTPLGTVRAVQNYGAGDLIEIAGAGGPDLVVPFTRAAVPAVDLAAGRIVVDPPPETGGSEAAS